MVQALDSKKIILFYFSSFSYKGEEIPYEPYAVKMSMFKNIFQTIIHLESNFSYLYEPLMNRVTEDHIRIILFSGKLDCLWPRQNLDKSL